MEAVYNFLLIRNKRFYLVYMERYPSDGGERQRNGEIGGKLPIHSKTKRYTNLTKSCSPLK